MKKGILFLAFLLTVLFSGISVLYFCNQDSHPNNMQLASNQIKIKRIEDCPRCNGTGQITIKETHYPCKGEGCEACDYKGYIEMIVECPRCNGTGKVEVNIN